MMVVTAPAQTTEPTPGKRRPASTPRTGRPAPAPEAPEFRDAQAETERLARFAAELEAIRDRVQAKIGEEDVGYIKRVRRYSRAFEIVGRGLLWISFEPVSWSVGVISLWLHKQLEATEIGHTALHGAFDRLEGAEKFRSKSFKWRTPIDEESWRLVHNGRHHGHTNVAGRDPDIHFGPMRLNEHTPYRPIHRRQVPFSVFLAANFGFLINVQYSGLNDQLSGNGRPEEFDFATERSPSELWNSAKRAFRKYIPYYAREYVLYPALAGPFFWKVLAGNWLSETMRDLYSAATIFCGHVGEDVADYPDDARPAGRAEWYKMQVEAANNFDVPLPVSVLCGALDLQIEHHLFPRFPTNRLREIAPEVRAVCEKYGVDYKSDTWPRTLAKVYRRLAQLSRPTPEEAAAAARARA